MSKAIVINGKKYTSTTVAGLAQRIGTAGDKRDADITELASACAVQAASGNLNWFNDVLLSTKGILHSVTGKPTVEGKAIIAYLKLVYPAVAFDDTEKAFSFVEGVNREKYFTGEVREKKGKMQKVKVPFDEEFAGFPLTFGAFKNEWHEKSGKDEARDTKAKSVCSRLTKLADTLEEKPISANDRAEIEAMRKALADAEKRINAAILKAEDGIEGHEQGAAEMLEGTVGSHERRADMDRAVHNLNAEEMEAPEPAQRRA